MIIRTKKGEAPFAFFHREALDDESLSWKATGIAAYLLSRPDDWEVVLKHLENKKTDGRDSTRSGIQELMDAGYLVRHRKRDKRGAFTSFDYNMHEHPPKKANDEDEATSGKSNSGKPDTGKSTVGKSASTKEEYTNEEKTIGQAELIEHPLVKYIKENAPRVAKMRSPLTSEQAAKLMSHYKEKYPKLFPEDKPLKKALAKVVQDLNDHVNSTKRFSADKNIRRFLDNHIEWNLLTPSEGGSAKKPKGEREYTIDQANTLFMNNFSGTNSTGTPFDKVFKKVGGEGSATRFVLNDKYRHEIKNWKV